MSYDDIDAIEEDDDSAASTYLTFQVGGEEYAVEVAHVTEIVRLQKAFSVPDVPGYVRGVINLRGKVIPLVDVRSRFGLPDAPYTDRTVVVVLEVGDASTGLVVDAVSDVAEIPSEQVEVHEGLRTFGNRSMIKGLGKRSDKVSFILDVQTLLSRSETVADASAPAAPAARAS